MISREEFENSLLCAMNYWHKKDKEEIFELIGKCVADMVEFDQNNPHHCFDLFTHILRVVDNISFPKDKYLATAAFFHDIGKPMTAIYKNGHKVYYGHAAKSSVIVEEILQNLNFKKDEIDLVKFYVRHHDDFISYELTEYLENTNLVAITEINIKKYAEKLSRKYVNLVNKYGIKTLLLNLIILCLADVKAQATIVYKEDKIIDTMEHKVIKLNKIRNVIESIL